MKKSNDEMIKRLLKYTNAGEIGTVRNTFLACAAFSMAILVALTQVGVQVTALKIAVIGCSFAAPIWIGLALILEVYLHIGEPSFLHLQQLRVSKIFNVLPSMASVALFIALCGIIYFLLPYAAIVFLIASFISFVYVTKTYASLASWFYTLENQSNVEDQDSQ